MHSEPGTGAALHILGVEWSLEPIALALAIRTRPAGARQRATGQRSLQFSNPADRSGDLDNLPKLLKVKQQMINPFCNALGVLKAATLKQLMAESGRAGQLAVDGWAATNPKQVKTWEADGSLVRRAQEADGQAEEATRMYNQDKQRDPGLPTLASHEIYELYGGPMLKL